ncbi:RNA polymerase sigma factor [Lysobacter terrae]
MRTLVHPHEIDTPGGTVEAQNPYQPAVALQGRPVECDDSTIEPAATVEVCTDMNLMAATRWSGTRSEAGKTPSLRAVDEAALLGRVAAEEIDAFETLYRLYYPRLARFLHGMTRRPALVEEVLDDTMLVVWRKAYTYDATSKVSTWLFAIAYRQALKALRRVDCVLAFDEADIAEPAQSGPEGELQRRQLHAHLDGALDALPPMHRAVIELTYYHGHSCREIAEIMGCPVATVKTRMFHARHKLRALLDSDLDREVL